jgi:hypothetical protein
MASQPSGGNGSSLDEAISRHRAALQSLSEDNEQKGRILDQLGQLLFLRYRQQSNLPLSDITNSITYGKEALRLTVHDGSLRSRVAHAIGHRFRVKFERTGNEENISQAIKFAEEAITQVPDTETGPKLQMIQELGDHYTYRENKFGSVNDACKAIQQYAIVARAACPQQVDVSRLWNNLANQFEAILNKLSDIEDCDIVIQEASTVLAAMDKGTVNIAPPLRQAVRAGLAETLRIRYSRTKSLQDLEQARSLIMNLQSEVGPRHRYFKPFLSSLIWIHGECSNQALTLRSQCVSSPNFEILNQALGLASQAFEFLSIHGTEELKACAANNRGLVLELIFYQRGDKNALKLAQEMAVIAIKSTRHDNKFRKGRIDCLARYTTKFQSLDPSSIDVSSLRATFRSYVASTYVDGNSSQPLVEEAQFLMLLSRECMVPPVLDDALDLYKSLASRKGCLSTQGLRDYAIAAVERYKYKWKLEDLNLALHCVNQALDQDESQGDCNHMNYMILGNILSERYQASKKAEDIQEAICRTEQALAIAPEDSMLKMNLGNKYRWRFEALGAGEDILRAVNLCKESTESETTEYGNLGRKLNNYGQALSLAHLRTGDIKYLDDAIVQGKRMESIWRNIRPSIDNLYWISNYAIQLCRRAEWWKEKGISGAHSDITHAIDLTKEAYDVAARLGTRNFQAAMANNLGRRYETKARIESDRADENMQKAVEFAREAVKLTDPYHPSFCYRTRNLAQFLELVEGPDQYNSEVLENYRKSFATETADIGHRLESVKGLANRLMVVGDVQTLDQELEKAVALIPKLQLQALRRENQQQRVKLISELSCLSAAAALSVGPTDEGAAVKAISRLEQGRGMISGSLLDQREENGELYTYARELYNELLRLQNILESNSSDAQDGDQFDATKAGHFADTRIRTSQDLDGLEIKIRDIPRFRRFRMPLSRGEYKEAAQRGPIIILNPTRLRADAIIIQDTKIEALALPNLTIDDARSQAASLQTALNAVSKPNQKKRELLRNTGRVNSMLKNLCIWLWNTYVERILSHLGYVRDSSPVQPLPHIWWVCCDVLSMFPIHAAGNYDLYPLTNTMTYCISSYATTIKSLLFARRPRSTSLSAQVPSTSLNPTPMETLLAVPMPTTPGQTPLNTTAELAAIKSHLPSTITFNPLTNPTTETVLSHLPLSAIAHFACHGSSNPLNPSTSRLLLTDYKTHPLTVARIGTLKLKSTRLA